MNKSILLFVLFTILLLVSRSRQDVACDACTLIVGYAETYLAESSTEQDVENFLDNKVCDLVGGFKVICQGLVTNYPELVQHVEKRETPTVACTQLTLCSSNQTKPLLKLNKVQPLLTLKKPEPKKVGDSGVIECTLCKALIQLGEEELSSNATEQEVENFLENKVCDLLPSVFGQECDNLVSQYLPALVSELEARETPAVACGHLHLCNTTQTKPLLKLNKVQPLLTLKKPEPKKVGDSGVGCTICEVLIQLGEQELASNATETEVEDFCENKVCGLLPSVFGQECDALVEQYLPELVQELVARDPPNVACDKIGLCSSTQSKPLLKLNKVQPLLTLKKPEAKKVSDSGIGCTVCEVLIQLGEQELASNATETEIEDFCENKVCDLLPSVFGQECDNLVSQYLPALVSELEARDPPNVACDKIGLCSSNQSKPLLKLNKVQPLLTLKKPVLKLKPVLFEPKPETNFDMCGMCTSIVSLVEARVSHSASNQEIEQMVANVCNSLGPLRNQCNQLIFPFITQFEYEYHKTTNVNEICADLKYC